MSTQNKTQRKNARLALIEKKITTEVKKEEETKNETREIPSLFPCQHFGMMYQTAKQMDRSGILRFDEPDISDLINNQLALILLNHYEKRIWDCHHQFLSNKIFSNEIERTDAMYAMFMPEITKLPMNATNGCRLDDEKEVSMAYYLFYLPNKHLNQLGKSSIAQAIRDGCSSHFS
jgi:hypothetical protein